MKKLLTLSAILTVISVSISADIYGQSVMQAGYLPTSGSLSPLTPSPGQNATIRQLPMVHPKNGMTATPNNYRSFSVPNKKISQEGLAANAGYESHPEIGELFVESPCENCYELIGKRTEISKTYIKDGSNGRDIMQQTSTMPMHYRDAQGNWRTIKTQLQPDNAHKGVYAANEQPSPISINTINGNNFSSIGKEGKSFQFNHNLELLYAKPDGSEVSLGKADWTNHIAGDEGVYVTNAWPGIDIEIHTFRGAVKTNFLINHAMPEYAVGKLLVRDHMQMDNGFSLYLLGQIKNNPLSFSKKEKYTGDLEVRNNAENEEYIISEASAYELKNAKASFQLLEYYITGNTVDIALTGDFLNRAASSYPVIIDPLVSVATTLPIPPDGSTYSTTFAARTGCLYTNPATTPANCTITDIQFANQYTARAGAVINDGAMEFYLGTCRSPGATTGLAGLFWYCNPIIPAPGTCTAAGGATYSMWTDFAPCVPAPQCAPYNLNVNMYLYQQYATTAACANTYIYLTQPLIITVIGHTVEIVGGAAGVTATPATICAGSSSTLSVSGTYGVPPYTWSWTPGGLPGTPVTVSPATTTTYTATVTDACGITASAGKVVTVNPVATITGPTAVCVGNTITLSNGGVAGAWTSLTPAVATVVAGTGVVTGVAAGTDVIRYTATTGGCTSTYTITVTPLPGAIGGTTSVCVGNTTTLNNPVAGGVWSSSTTTVATIDPATGVVSGVTPGTTTITYSLGGSCLVTTVVTVNQVGPVTGNLTICLGSTTVLSDASAGGTWSSGSPGVATIDVNTGIVYSVSTGTSTMTYTSLNGCTATAVVTVDLLAAITGTTTICAGLTTALSDAASPGTWSSSNIGVATVGSTDGMVSGVSGGTVTITFFTPLGCSTTIPVTINPLPGISSIMSTNPTTCGGSDGSITLNGLTSGNSYLVNYDYNGTPAGTLTITATGGSQVLINVPSTGLLFSGSYTNIYVTDAVTHCQSNIVGPVTLVDPLPPPPAVISSNEPICIGQTLLLAATDTLQGGTYSWAGPNGFTSTDQNPRIDNVPAAASGVYTVTYTLWNCPSPSTANIILYPPIILTNITPSQTILYGTSIQLNADGALYYMWKPNDGSLNNPNINNPVATPQISTVFTVYGTNLAGCEDSASITITIDSTTIEMVPSAFTPNGDGLNDVFRITNLKYQKLVEFNVYNRWGQMVYHNTYDTKQGWDGTFNGVPQDIGIYNYSIIVISAEGITKYYKGDVTLIR